MGAVRKPEPKPPVATDSCKSGKDHRWELVEEHAVSPMKVMGRYKRIFRCRRCGQSAFVMNKGFKWSSLTRPFRRLKVEAFIPTQSADPKQQALFARCK